MQPLEWLLWRWIEKLDYCSRHMVGNSQRDPACWLYQYACGTLPQALPQQDTVSHELDGGFPTHALVVADLRG